MTTHLTRRELLGRSLRTGAGLGIASFVVKDLYPSVRAAQASDMLAPAFRALDDFVRAYMRTMDAPGLTLSLADRTGVLSVASYGYSNTERAIPVDASQLFEIGSITKSFVAIAVLQLVDEKKIDLHRPVAEFMPWR